MYVYQPIYKDTAHLLSHNCRGGRVLSKAPDVEVALEHLRFLLALPLELAIFDQVIAELLLAEV